MTPQEAFDQQIAATIGALNLAIAKQCAAVTERDNRIAELQKEIEVLKSGAVP